jgi:hypothetical protein
MEGLCQYRDILGKPNAGVHSTRVFGFALVDIVLSIVGAWVINYFIGGNYWGVLLGVIVVGMIMHWLFCVRTRLNVLLGLVR